MVRDEILSHKNCCQESTALSFYHSDCTCRRGLTRCNLWYFPLVCWYFSAFITGWPFLEWCVDLKGLRERCALQQWYQHKICVSVLHKAPGWSIQVFLSDSCQILVIVMGWSSYPAAFLFPVEKSALQSHRTVQDPQLSLQRCPWAPGCCRQASPF